MSYGKTIELFLVNGTAESIVIAELSNWNGKAIKIPRTEVISCNRDDLKSAGTYFLFCKMDDGSDAVYIGEAENIYDRLRQHLQDYQSNKESYYWNSAVAFIGRDLDKALIRYLENRFVEMARQNNRYSVLTKNTYKNTVLKESKVAAMEEYIDHVKVIINALGYRVLEPTPTANEQTTKLYCKSASACAEGFVSAGGFTVSKGSKISDHITPSFPTAAKPYYDLRQKLINEGIIDGSLFTVDYEFNAPSAASAVVLGRSSNGKIDWKDASGTPLNKI